LKKNQNTDCRTILVIVQFASHHLGCGGFLWDYWGRRGSPHLSSFIHACSAFCARAKQALLFMVAHGGRLRLMGGRSPA
jgi:hypothetical protein